MNQTLLESAEKRNKRNAKIVLACLFSMFLNIPPESLTNMILPDKTQEEIFDEKIKEFLKKHDINNYKIASSFLHLPSPNQNKKEISKASTSEALTVILDAGHGGEDGGAVGKNGVYEKDLNLQIACMLNDLLRANGVSTVC